MLLLAAPFLLRAKVTLCKIKGAILRWKKIINGKSFLLRVMWYFEFWSHVMSPYPVKFGIHRTWKLAIKCFLFVTRLHIISWLFGSHEPMWKQGCNFFYLSHDYCIMLPLRVITPLLIRHHHFKFSRHGFAENETCFLFVT